MHAKRTIALVVAITVALLASVRDARGQANFVAPAISSVSPAAPSRSRAPQVLTVTGSSFLAGLSLDVVTPDGQKQNYRGPAIQARRDTSFQVSMVLAAPGSYTLTVTNADGTSSEPFVLKGQPAAAAPTIDRVQPEQLTKDPQPRVLTITGSRFAEGLSVSLTDPIGTVFLIKGSAIGAVSATAFEVSVVFEMVGDYSFMVTNASGESSNNVTLKVVARTVR